MDFRFTFNDGTIWDAYSCVDVLEAIISLMEHNKEHGKLICDIIKVERL